MKTSVPLSMCSAGWENTDLLVSIIKLIEDKMNLEHDVNEVGVQLILLVEDGIRFTPPSCPICINSY